MQGSVHEFDSATGSGSVLLDDGVRLRFSPDAFARSGLRLLRVGQRLTVDLEDDRVVGLRIVGV
jgi:2-phospho-L-lactate guanylyltransferase